MEAVTECTEEKLHKFSLEHYTYINQIFGDRTVREIISEVFPNDEYEFVVEKLTVSEETMDHHILHRKITNDETIEGNPLERKVICSVLDGQQNLYVDVNDTLCQSYSLLNYFGIPIVKNKKQRQMDMIQMYRDIILKNETFLEQFNTILKNPDYIKKKKPWRNYTISRKKYSYIRLDLEYILRKIHEALDKWESYGYWHFIGKGHCPGPKHSSLSRPKRSGVDVADIISMDTRSMRPRAQRIIESSPSLGGGRKRTTRKKQTPKGRVPSSANL